eukprot:scaffold119472_cov21-Tisochrysis_lutea.AAC.3
MSSSRLKHACSSSTATSGGCSAEAGSFGHHPDKGVELPSTLIRGAPAHTQKRGVSLMFQERKQNKKVCQPKERMH